MCKELKLTREKLDFILFHIPPCKGREMLIREYSRELVRTKQKPFCLKDELKWNLRNV